MGEVYRANDTRLDRTVAIKVLPEHLADRPERRQRFEREARAISSLNHPHICTLHDVGHQDGIDFLVMEYVEGEALDVRLRRGSLPLDETLRYAIQIADALDHAHRQGFTHRDLKPANIILTKSGAKLLDFGLAKLGPGSRTLGATQTALTAEGTIAGTLQYMAPEQLHGKEIDGRTDLFAFGAVVYEMATGRKAFEGPSQASVIAAILDSHPQRVSQLLPACPPALDRMLQQCLDKDPDQRWQSARDLMLELRWIADSPASPSAPAPARPRRRVWWAALAAAAALAIAGWTLALLPRSSTPERLEFAVYPPPGANFVFGINAGGSAISPDGRTLAFVAAAEGKPQLWVRRLDSVQARMLAGTEWAYYPFWSPDSRWLGFFSEGKLKKIEVEARAAAEPQVLCGAEEGRGGSWNRDGVILFSAGGGGGRIIQQVPAAGGKPVPVAVDSAVQDLGKRWPQFLPDGRRFVYLVRAAQPTESAIHLGSLDSSAPASGRLLQAQSNALYATPGYLLFVRGRSLVAQPFDAGSLRIHGDASLIVEQIGYVSPMQVGDFSASANGVLAYGTTAVPVTQLTWYSREGRPLGRVGPPGPYLVVNLSPDQRTAAVWADDARTGNMNIRLVEVARGVASRLTSQPSIEVMPVWSPDGKQILFAVGRRGNPNLYLLAASGAGQAEELLPPGETRIPSDWSRDGRMVLYSSLSDRTQWDLWAVPLAGERKPAPFVQTPFNEAEGQFSPSARWVAYRSDESGRPEIYARRFPDAGEKVQISTAGGTQPRWRSDGRELFYLAPDGNLMAVDVREGERLEASEPRALFRTRTPPAGSPTSRTNFAVAADGRFLVNAIAEEAGASPITVVVNWTAGLKR
jgi:Tol biopolymer transport system component